MDDRGMQYHAQLGAAEELQIDEIINALENR